MPVVHETGEVCLDPFITTTKGMSGWFAVHVWWNPEHGGFWEPYDTGHGRYATREEAQEEAKNWALMDNMRYEE